MGPQNVANASRFQSRDMSRLELSQLPMCWSHGYVSGNICVSLVISNFKWVWTIECGANCPNPSRPTIAVAISGSTGKNYRWSDRCWTMQGWCPEAPLSPIMSKHFVVSSFPLDLLVKPPPIPPIDPMRSPEMVVLLNHPIYRWESPQN